MQRVLALAVFSLALPATSAHAAQPSSAGSASSPAVLSTIRVQAIRVADDDGSRQTLITLDEVRAWLAYADNVYRPAGLRFEFDPTTDFTDLRSTAINSMMPAPESRRADLQSTLLHMRDIAASNKDKLTIFFRFGDKAKPTGNGFSSADAAYVVAPGFSSTSVCGHQNLGLLAHEIGHYLGLDHTFAREFATVAEADKFFSEIASDISRFEGDGIDDTPPDPFIREIQCNDTAAVTLAGLSIPICRDNVMSYYEVPARVLTPGQIRRALWILDWRRAHGMVSARNTPANPIEIESLDVTREDDLNFRTSQPMTGFGWYSWSASGQLFVGAQGTGKLTLKLEVPRSARYRVVLYATLAPDYGIIQTSLDGARLGQPIDLYGPKVLATGAIELRTMQLNAGPRELTFRVTGKNPLASSHNFGLDAIELIPD